MSREIKFRAFDNDESTMKMVYSDNEKDNAGYYFDITDKVKCLVDCCHCDSTGYEIDDWEPLDNIMEFTGLKDKKDKEIYENDIVKCSSLGISEKPGIIIGVVKQIDGCFTVVFNKPVYDAISKCYRKNLYVKCFVVNDDIEIIGNIYETPELLE